MSKSSHVWFRLFVAWNIHIIAFLPIFVFLLLLFCWSLYCLSCFWLLLTVFLCSFYVVFELSYWCVDAIFNADESMGCKALRIVMSFLVLRSICWSYLIHFKNGSKYLTRGRAQVFISLMRFLQYSLILSSFLVLLKIFFFNFFFHLHLFDGVHFLYSSIWKYVIQWHHHYYK